MSLLRRIFIKFSNIMIAHYIKKSLVEEIALFDFILCDVTIYLLKNSTCKWY
jgi:hypothetical protein